MQIPRSPELSQQSAPLTEWNRPRPFLTAGRPGTGGVLKERPRDFEVEEIPAYLPVGEGEHLFIWIEKEDVSAEQLTRHIARNLHIPVSEIGVAGLKDRRAVTRQFVSVPARCEALVNAINSDGIRVLDVRRHGNKLRTGHLKGNRFSVLVRKVVPDALASANDVRQRIERVGAPNFFGSQRYGHEGETLSLGLQLLKGLKSARDLPGARRKFLLRLALSAVQSSLFDEVVTARITDGLIGQVIAGDVMQVSASGGLFVAEELPREQARLDMLETVITGPMFGPKMIEPAGDAALRESRVLERNAMARTDFERFPKLTSGTRRPFVVHPAELQIEPDDDGLRFRFTLPSGVYATTILREFMKNEVPSAAG